MATEPLGELILPLITYSSIFNIFPALLMGYYYYQTKVRDFLILGIFFGMNFIWSILVQYMFELSQFFTSERVFSLVPPLFLYTWIFVFFIHTSGIKHQSYLNPTFIIGALLYLVLVMLQIFSTKMQIGVTEDFFGLTTNMYTGGSIEPMAREAWGIELANGTVIHVFADYAYLFFIFCMYTAILYIVNISTTRLVLPSRKTKTARTVWIVFVIFLFSMYFNALAHIFGIWQGLSGYFAILVFLSVFIITILALLMPESFLLTETVTLKACKLYHKIQVLDDQFHPLGLNSLVQYVRSIPEDVFVCD